MPTQILSKLVVKKDIEPLSSWDSLCRDPNEFLDEIASRLILSYTIDAESVVISDKVPTSTDRNKLWIKTSWPYGIAKLISGKYQVDYGMTGFPTAVPFQASDSHPNILMDKVRKLSDVEVKEYGLFFADATKATRKMSWYIFEPDDIEY
jgi:hypothetical protein